MWGIISFLVVGLVAGWLASVIMKTNDSQGMGMDLLLGVVGSFVGGFLMNFLTDRDASGLNLYSVVVATLGAVVLIWLMRMMKK